uniref:RNase H type-1 domain-containing protein n=1 Tax=Nelumbo nucifera TaxID=4432 RepID=A0A822YL26_NELNU|nr:TPA_asm: hypothetical protein HUJ06_012073 [Nelumbo nucifera]
MLASAPLMAERLALFEALKILLPKVLVNIVVELDYTQLVNQLLDHSSSSLPDLVFVKENISKQCEGRSISYCWVPCEINRAAHLLAKKGFTSNLFSEEAFPLWLSLNLSVVVFV